MNRYKKLIFTLGIIFSSLTMIKSQTSLKVGSTIASLSTDDNFLFSKSPAANLFVGLHYQLFFNNLIGLEPGLTYYKLSTKIKSGNTAFKLTRSYIGVPILVKFFPKSMFSFGGGLQAGFLASDNFEDNFENNNFDVSGQLQVTFTPIKQVGIELGYNYGLTPYVEFKPINFNNLQFQEGDARNKYFYATFLLNLR